MTSHEDRQPNSGDSPALFETRQGSLEIQVSRPCQGDGCKWEATMLAWQIAAPPEASRN
jgi:hypothetical protein